MDHDVLELITKKENRWMVINLQLKVLISICVKDEGFHKIFLLSDALNISCFIKFSFDGFDVLKSIFVLRTKV